MPAYAWQAISRHITVAYCLRVRMGRPQDGDHLLHLDRTVHLGRLHSAGRVEGAGNLLDDVYEDFISAPAASAVGVQNGLDDACGALAHAWQQCGCPCPLH